MKNFLLSEPFYFEVGEVIEANNANEELRKIDKHLSTKNFQEFVLAAHNNIQDKIALSDKNALGALWQLEMTLALRTYLAMHSWILESWAGGAYLCLSSCRTKCIIVATGTSDVGRQNGKPMNSKKR